MTSLPTSEELTEHAAEAEQILEILSCNSQLSCPITDALDMSPEEERAMLEFEEKDREEEKAVMAEFENPEIHDSDEFCTELGSVRRHPTRRILSE